MPDSFYADIQESFQIECLEDFPFSINDYRFYLERNFKVKDLLEVRDQKEVDRFQCIFNRMDFVLAWEEKASQPLAVQTYSVGELPLDIVKKIAKYISWPQVRWELRDDEKAFDAEQNPIYKQALRERQIANETAKRILGSARRPSEGRVEELDGEPQQKRAKTTQNPQI